MLSAVCTHSRNQVVRMLLKKQQQQITSNVFIKADCGNSLCTSQWIEIEMRASSAQCKIPAPGPCYYCPFCPCPRCPCSRHCPAAPAPGTALLPLRCCPAACAAHGELEWSVQTYLWGNSLSSQHKAQHTACNHSHHRQRQQAVAFQVVPQVALDGRGEHGPQAPVEAFPGRLGGAGRREGGGLRVGLLALGGNKQLLHAQAVVYAGRKWWRGQVLVTFSLTRD